MTEPSRGRVAMVVANGVLRDSRVLKSARSAAQAGYEVVVFGDGGNAEPTTVEGEGFLIRVLRSSAEIRRSIRLSNVKAGVDATRVLCAELSPEARELEWESLLDFAAVMPRIGEVAWRDTPRIVEMDEVLGAALDEFEPDLVHCHDVHFIAIVAAHVARARHRGRDPRWVYDAHELVEGLWPAAARSAAMVAAWADVEDQVIGRADAVVTVSPDLAAVLERHHDLSRTPTVVLNAPDLRTASGRGGRTVRDAAGLGIDVPLLVYGGGLTEGRGVETVIDGLEYLPGVHLAIICVPSPDAPYAQHLAAFAAEHGVADRVHLVPPVPPQEVCTFLRGADLGVHPMLRCGNHDIALPNKLFEYLFAGLPLVVSDVPALAGFVEERMVGRSFTAGDPRAFAVAVRRVLFDLAGFRERAGDPALVQTYCWERQADRLLGVYEEVLAR